MDKRKIIDYRTVMANCRDLDDDVRECMKLGFEPFGSLSAVDTGTCGVVCFQAFVKYEEEETDDKEMLAR